MAIIVSQSLASAHPLDHDAQKGVGLKLPLTNSSNGWFDQTFTTAEAIRMNLINILLTMKGERPMNPRFGSDLGKVVFEQNDSTIQPKIETAVRTAVAEYLPFVVIDSVRVTRESIDVDIYRSKVTITYHIPNVVGFQDLAFLIQA